MRYCLQCGAAFRSMRTCPKDKAALVAATADPLVGRVLGDRYRVLESIGAGGMGQVYRAAHTRIACVFAVKVVWGDLAYDQNMQARFMREAETASCLSSRYIARVTDFGGDDRSLPYLVMEYLEGWSVRDVIDRDGRVTPTRAARIAERMARGLAHAHSRGVVHRDLKPDNVYLVREDDEHDIVKLLDFGIAAVERANEKLTMAGVVVGTPQYMPTEQLTGGAVDARSDLYALGIVLYEMIVGTVPFDSESLETLFKKHAVEPVPSIKKQLFEARAPAVLDDIVQRLLAKRPEDRFQTAREVAVALASALQAPVPAAVAAPTIASAPLDPIPASEVTSVPASLLSFPLASVVPAAPPPKSPVPPAVGALLERAILQGAPMYNAGDHAGCAALYRSTSLDVINRFPQPVAVSARLTAAVRRADTRTDRTTAAWDLRNAFDDLLRSPPAPTSGDDEMSIELAAFAAIASQREAKGQLELLGDYEVTFARALAGRLATQVQTRAFAATLETAAANGERVGGGEAARPIVSPILAELRNRARGNVSAMPLPEARVTRLSVPVASADSIRERLVRAIRVGAPLYNEGDKIACARLYREAAQEALEIATRDPDGGKVADVLRQALLEAQSKEPNAAAWALRHAFDAILAA